MLAPSPLRRRRREADRTALPAAARYHRRTLPPGQRRTRGDRHHHTDSRTVPRSHRTAFRRPEASGRQSFRRAGTRRRRLRTSRGPYRPWHRTCSRTRPPPGTRNPPRAGRSTRRREEAAGSARRYTTCRRCRSGTDRLPAACTKTEASMRHRTVRAPGRSRTWHPPTARRPQRHCRQSTHPSRCRRACRTLPMRRQTPLARRAR
jgi:hypothetical protein